MEKSEGILEICNTGNAPFFLASEEGAGSGLTQVARVRSGPHNPNRISAHVKAH